MFQNLLSLARRKPLALAAWALALALAIEFAHRDLGFAFAVGDFRSSTITMLGRDFVNVFTAGHLVLDGQTGIAYDVGTYREYQSALFDGKVRNHNYSYPPISFFYTWAFALTPYGISYLLWVVLTGGAFALAARPYLRDAHLSPWLVFVIPAAIANIWAGHYGFLLAAFWLAAWRNLDAKPALAGILFGLMFVKPHLGVLIPLVLAWRGAWNVIAWAAATVVVLVLASGFAFGWQLWIDYVSNTLLYQASLVNAATQEFFLTMMPTVAPSMRLAGLPETAAWVVQGVVAIGAVAALLKWLPRDAARAGLATATATFLVLPYAFNYDLTIVGVAALIYLHRDEEVPMAFRFVAALTFLLPLLLLRANYAGIPLGPVVLALMLALLLKRGRAAAGGAGDGDAPAFEPWRGAAQPAASHA